MMSDDEITPVTMVLGCIPKSRGLTEDELIERYQRACKKHNVVALWGQIRSALRTLKQAGKIRLEDGKVRRT